MPHKKFEDHRATAQCIASHDRNHRRQIRRLITALRQRYGGGSRPHCAFCGHQKSPIEVGDAHIKWRCDHCHASHVQTWFQDDEVQTLCDALEACLSSHACVSPVKPGPTGRTKENGEVGHDPETAETYVFSRKNKQQPEAGQPPIA